jgi:hypothetical protein
MSLRRRKLPWSLGGALFAASLIATEEQLASTAALACRQGGATIRGKQAATIGIDTWTEAASCFPPRA